MDMQTNYANFLKDLKSESTRHTYSTAIKNFLRLHYPESQFSIPELTDLYFHDRSSIPRDERTYKFENDLKQYKRTISKLAGLTQQSYVAGVIRFLEDIGHAEFSDKFRKRIYETEHGNDAVNEERIPSNAEIARIVEYMPLHARTLTLMLSSSGMRVGECLALKSSDIMLDKNPVRINIRAEATKTKKKRVTFISSEAKAILQEWILYKNKTFTPKK